MKFGKFKPSVEVASLNWFVESRHDTLLNERFTRSKSSNLQVTKMGWNKTPRLGWLEFEHAVSTWRWCVGCFSFTGFQKKQLRGPGCVFSHHKKHKRGWYQIFCRINLHWQSWASKKPWHLRTPLLFFLFWCYIFECWILQTFRAHSGPPNPTYTPTLRRSRSPVETGIPMDQRTSHYSAVRSLSGITYDSSFLVSFTNLVTGTESAFRTSQKWCCRHFCWAFPGRFLSCQDLKSMFSASKYCTFPILYLLPCILHHFIPYVSITVFKKRSGVFGLYCYIYIYLKPMDIYIHLYTYIYLITTSTSTPLPQKLILKLILPFPPPEAPRQRSNPRHWALSRG